MRALLPVLIIAASALAGCAKEPAPPAPSEPDPCLVAAPDDYACLEAAGHNLTADQRPHLHDYWGGQQRITVMDAPHRDLGPGFAGTGEPYPVHEYRGDTDEVIPQGTSKVHVTLTWTDDDADVYDGAELWAKTAAEDALSPRGAIVSGESVTLEVGEMDWDLPHQRLSAWIFELRLGPDPLLGFVRFKGETNILVEAERGLPIPLYPAHPDLWNGEDEILLLDDSHTLAYMHDLGDGGCNGFSCPFVHTPGDGIVVPFDASAVEVTLRWERGFPTELGMQYHGADTRAWTRPTPAEVGADSKTYRIDVTTEADGPYALQSLWEFTTFVEAPLADSFAFEDYTLTAKALR